MTGNASESNGLKSLFQEAEASSLVLFFASSTGFRQTTDKSGQNVDRKRKINTRSHESRQILNRETRKKEKKS